MIVVGARGALAKQAIGQGPGGSPACLGFDDRLGRALMLLGLGPLGFSGAVRRIHFTAGS